ncbi:tellurite resistance TerB family protein [Neorhizobium galegae]|uniref:Tellurite resistance TerB family protein n=1 Tax=Neorhizobium galegae TaxID=399 RepID=A0A6A1TTX0_NEOGA|nr:tellurite resistance TerB family protein [Neorhizobium galegae]KAB1088022.1 tellurite resistance TerB family protein [Neorhizobium galegae]MCQ1850604.1 tellurite resistance TerB family protein [Neorhizobium galegae]
MFDAKKLLDQFLGSQIPGMSGGSVKDRAGQATQLAKNNPLATGAILAAVLGTKTGRNIAGNVAAVGGIAAIAGLGYLAYKNYQSGKSPEAVPQADKPLLTPPADSPFHPQSPALTNDFALTLVRAMIAAAKADGHIDAGERANIMDKVHAVDLGAEAEAFIENELANPVDIDDLVAAARTEEQKVEIYAASRLTIDPDTRAERGYLDLLAGRLGLDDALIEHIDATVSAAKVKA